MVSQATGFQKPQKEIFNLAAEQFEMNPDTTLYVGDSYDNDIKGAHDSGWHSMWFNHRGRRLKAGTKPVLICRLILLNSFTVQSKFCLIYLVINLF